jgi:hypothetical protein
MTTRTQRVGKMDLFTLNSGKVVSIDWGWVHGRESPTGHPYPDFPYGFQSEDESEDVDLTDDEREELEAWIYGNIEYDYSD